MSAISLISLCFKTPLSFLSWMRLRMAAMISSTLISGAALMKGSMHAS